MKLSECKDLMRGYRKCAEEGNVVFNWLTTARWSLRHSWAAEERDAAIARAERAEAALAAVPWRALANVVMCGGAISAADEAAISEFMIAHADALASSDNDLLSDGLEEK